ncbi:MAG: ParA family protein [Culicoidibacterales bacterium]
MKIIAIANQKGGVGKTSFTTNVGRTLALKGYRVLLVDTDSQTNLTRNILQINVNKSFANVLQGNVKNLKEIIYQTDIAKLNIIPSTPILEEIEKDLVTKTKREYKFLKFLEKNYDTLAEQYDYMIVDTKPQKSIINANIFLVADEVILMTDMDINSVDGLTTMIDWWKYMQSENQLDEIVDNMHYIILNHIEEHTKIYTEVNNFLKKGIAELKLLDTQIAKTVKIKEATLLGKSMVEIYPHHKVSQQFIDIINEMFTKKIL